MEELIFKPDDLVELPKITPEQLEDSARRFAKEAVEVLVNTMHDTMQHPKTRMEAAIEVLDRAFGKPRQSLKKTEEVEPSNIDLSALSPEELVLWRTLLEKVQKKK